MDLPSNYLLGGISFQFSKSFTNIIGYSFVKGFIIYPTCIDPSDKHDNFKAGENQLVRSGDSAQVMISVLQLCGILYLRSGI
jgi:hypothetical protein